MSPLAWVRMRLRRWWLARLRPSDHHALTQRNVYIVPTAPGLVLAATVVVLLVASINFQLNLGYGLTFLLAGCSVAGMYMGHATLRGLDLQLLPPPAHFLDTPALLTVQLHNAGLRPRYGVGLTVQDSDTWCWTEVPPQGSCALSLTWHAPHRGLLHLPVLSAESRFPMGAFRVWTLWQPAATVWVYPRPETPSPALPASQATSGDGTHAQVLTQADGDWDEVRSYRRGDTPKQIVWKKAAQALATSSGTLVSRELGTPQAAQLWLDFAATGVSEKEARISRLCAWVRSAERRGLSYGLRLPHHQIAPAHGPTHQRHCLEALALC